MLDRHEISGSQTPNAVSDDIELPNATPRQPEIESVFRRAVAIFPDPAHSLSEERFKGIGTTDEGRFVLVVFTLRWRGGQRLIRSISARYMHRKEIACYEQEVAKIAQRSGG